MPKNNLDQEFGPINPDATSAGEPLTASLTTQDHVVNADSLFLMIKKIISAIEFRATIEYDTGDQVWDSGTRILVSKTDSNTGNALPVSPTLENTFWRVTEINIGAADHSIITPNGLNVTDVIKRADDGNIGKTTITAGAISTATINKFISVLASSLPFSSRDLTGVRARGVGGRGFTLLGNEVEFRMAGYNDSGVIGAFQDIFRSATRTNVQANTILDNADAGNIGKSTITALAISTATINKFISVLASSLAFSSRDLAGVRARGVGGRGFILLGNEVEFRVAGYTDGGTLGNFKDIFRSDSRTSDQANAILSNADRGNIGKNTLTTEAISAAINNRFMQVQASDLPGISDDLAAIRVRGANSRGFILLGNRAEGLLFFGFDNSGNKGNLERILTTAQEGLGKVLGNGTLVTKSGFINSAVRNSAGSYSLNITLPDSNIDNYIVLVSLRSASVTVPNWISGTITSQTNANVSTFSNNARADKDFFIKIQRIFV